MNMTEKNGQPSMEEILASIRRIIAEEPGSHHNGELRGTPIMLKGDGVLEDTGDFDLPAIFRSSPPVVADRQAPLLGRLTDAIRNATAAQPETQPHTDTPLHADAGPAGLPASYAGLSSLKPVRTESRPATPAVAEPQPAVMPQFEAPVAAAPVPLAAAPPPAEGPSQAPKRVMAPFKDTHFLRMSTPSDAAPQTAATPEPPVEAPPQAALLQSQPPVDFSAIIPGEIDRATLTGDALQTPPPLAASEYQPSLIAASPSVTVPPPPLPVVETPRPDAVAAPAGYEETGSIEDTTADLLRPMLRQWLADNMPRMVEKALHIEIAESVKAPKKP